MSEYVPMDRAHEHRQGKVAGGFAAEHEIDRHDEKHRGAP